MMSSTPLHRALQAEPFNGSQSKFAIAIGTSQQNISNWLRKGKPLPVEYVPRAVEVSGIPAHEWRPDLPGIFPPPASANEAA